jgi:hypothetical protein
MPGVDTFVADFGLKLAAVGFGTAGLYPKAFRGASGTEKTISAGFLVLAIR